MEVLAAVPVRQAISPKSRLATVLSPRARRLLSLEMAARVVGAIEEAGARPVVLAADQVVMEWAGERGWEGIPDRAPSLNAAAAGAVAEATRRRVGWMIVHADLPLLTAADLRDSLAVVGSGDWVLAPSSDGGTSLIGGSGDPHFDFAYGEGSFHRHLARLRRRSPRVVFRPGLALDLDRPSDLQAALSHPRGRWLADWVTEVERWPGTRGEG
ncbi:MAG: 2-phospho-L-lactate guanylyltransferase [bacterium]|nr:2-phospho-L-lactate guanylyltransferase [bacterium]